MQFKFPTAVHSEIYSEKFMKNYGNVKLNFRVFIKTWPYIYSVNAINEVRSYTPVAQ